MVPKSVMQNANQMNGLHPIVRRVRRPLLPVDPPADAKPAQPGASGESEQGGESEAATVSEKGNEITSASNAAE